MPLLQELGTLARKRRLDIGLSQDALARLAGLSRATVSGLENGTLNNLASTRLEALANALGLTVGVLRRPPPAPGQALADAAQVASVPYKTALPPRVLQDALIQGTAPPGFIPHLRGLLEEAPTAMLVDMAEELEREQGVEVRATWDRMRRLARVLGCKRALWHSSPT